MTGVVISLLILVAFLAVMTALFRDLWRQDMQDGAAADWATDDHASDSATSDAASTLDRFERLPRWTWRDDRQLSRLLRDRY